MRVRGDAPHDDLCPSNDGSPGPVDCDFCERLYSADARGYTRGWSAGYEQGQRDEREAAAQRVIKQGVSIVAGRPPQEYIMLSLAVAAVRGEQT